MKMKLFSAYKRLIPIAFAFLCMACPLPWSETDAEDDGEMIVDPILVIIFDANGGTGTPPATQYLHTYSPSLVLPGGDGLAKSGYVFDGWNTKADGTGAHYNVGASYRAVGGGITFFAEWVVDENVAEAFCTISFDANGGSGTPPAAQNHLRVNTSIVLPDGDGLTKSGYAFAGWNTKADGTGLSYSAHVSYHVAGNITFYAKWVLGEQSSIIMTITFDPNGGNAPITTRRYPRDSNIWLSDPMQLYGHDLTLSGYVFTGWNTKPDGTGEVFYSEELLTIAYPRGDLTLYANWTRSVTGTWEGTVLGHTATMNVSPPGWWSMRVPELGWEDTEVLIYINSEYDALVFNISNYYSIAKLLFIDDDVLQVTFYKWYREELDGVVSIFNRVK